MRKILGLDLASRTGYALFDGRVLVDFGYFKEIETPFSKAFPGGKDHPWDLLKVVEDTIEGITNGLLLLEQQYGSFEIVIEQTNKSRNRFSQKLLEWLHYDLCKFLKGTSIKVHYIDTSAWRKTLNIRLDKETLNYVNSAFNLNLRSKDDDVADAISMAFAFIIKEKL